MSKFRTKQGSQYWIFCWCYGVDQCGVRRFVFGLCLHLDTFRLRNPLHDPRLQQLNSTARQILHVNFLDLFWIWILWFFALLNAFRDLPLHTNKVEYFLVM